MSQVIELPDIVRASVYSVDQASTLHARDHRRPAVIDYDDKSRIVQGSAFIEDAAHDRLTYHKCDFQFLKVYRFHGSWPCQFLIAVVIAILHLLIFFEDPSSLSITADVRSTNSQRLSVPHPILVSIEGVCMFILAMDCSVIVYGYGIKHLRSYPWHLLYGIILGLTFSGWFLSVCFGDFPCGVWCKFRCLLRPFILLQHSALMKKAFLCLIKAMPSIFSVFMLFTVHIVLFTLIGLVIMPFDKGPAQSSSIHEYRIHFGGGGSVDAIMNMLILLTTANSPDIMTKAYNENRFYAIFFIIYVAIGVHFLLHILFAVIFQKFREHFRESMRHAILRRKAALVAAFEVLADCDEDTLEKFVPIHRLAGVVKSLSLPYSMKEDIKRRVQSLTDSCTQITWRVFFHEIFITVAFPKKQKRNAIESGRSNSITRSLFDPLRKHRLAVEYAKNYLLSLSSSNQGDRPVSFVKRIPAYLRIIFAHPGFVHFGSLCTVVNVLFILSQYLRTEHQRFIEKETLFFIALYIFEQISVAWALRLRMYLAMPLHMLDLITVILVTVCAMFFSIVHNALVIPTHDEVVALLVLSGATHILIGLRMLRIVLSMKLPNLILRTITDLLVNLAPFIGLLACLYYIFAVIGMIIFSGKIHYSPEMEGCWRWEGNDSSIANSSRAGTECPYGGGFHQRDYWSETFDDFASSIVILWNLMLVNNWDIIVKAYSKATSPWAQIYFVVWYIASVGMTLSLLTAVIVENFLMRWSIFARHERNKKQLRLAERVHREHVAAQQFTEAASRSSGVHEAITRWRRGKRLRQRRANIANQGSTVGSQHDSATNSVVRPTQSQPLSLIQVLDVKMPSMEEIRQHLALSPYSPTGFALNIVTFGSTYDLSSHFQRQSSQV